MHSRCPHQFPVKNDCYLTAIPIYEYTSFFFCDFSGDYEYTFFFAISQVIWKNSRQIGAAWAIRKDKRLVISIKYKPGGNVVNYFGKNVLPPTAALLGPEWTRVPPKFTRCPSLITTTAGTKKVGTKEEGTISDIFAASERTASNIVNFTGSLVLAMLIS